MERRRIALDDQEKIAFNSEIAQRLSFLRVLARKGTSYLERAIMLINGLNDIPEEKLLNYVSFSHGMICKEYHQVITGYSPILFRSSLVWEYVFLLAYYFYNNDEIWRKHVLPCVLDFEVSPFVKAEMIQATCLVDDFKQRRENLKNDLQQNSAQKNYSNVLSRFYEPAPQFKVAPKRKTDVIKVLYYMMKLGMFVMEDDSPIKEKDFMTAIGTFFADDFSKYLQYNNKAAAMDNYRNVFYELLDLAEKKVLGEK